MPNSCPICGQTRRANCYGGEMDDETKCPGWTLPGGNTSVTDDMVQRAANAFVKSADHEVRLIDIRAALNAVF